MPVLINPNSALPLATGWKCRLSCSSFSLKLTGHCSQGGPALTWPEPRHAFKCCCTPQGVSAPVQSAPGDTLHPSSVLHICRRQLALSYVSLHEKRRELWSSKECLSLLNIHSLSLPSLSLCLSRERTLKTPRTAQVGGPGAPPSAPEPLWDRHHS